MSINAARIVVPTVFGLATVGTVAGTVQGIRRTDGAAEKAIGAAGIALGAAGVGATIGSITGRVPLAGARDGALLGVGVVVFAALTGIGPGTFD